jgi:hypothetical protein
MVATGCFGKVQLRYQKFETSRPSGKHRQSRLTASFSHNRPSADLSSTIGLVDCLSLSYQSAVSVPLSCVMTHGFSLHMVMLE